MSVDFMGARYRRPRRGLKGLGALSASAKAQAVLREIEALNTLYTGKYLPVAASASTLVNATTYQAQRVEQLAAAWSAKTPLEGVVRFVGSQAYVSGSAFASAIKAGLAQAAQNFSKAKTLLRGTPDEAYANLPTARRLRSATDGLVTHMQRVAAAVTSARESLGDIVTIAALVVAGAVVVVGFAIFFAYLEKLDTAKRAAEEADRRCAELAAEGRPCDRGAIIEEYTRIQSQTGVTGLVATVVPDIGAEAGNFFRTGSNIMWAGAAALGAYALWISLPAARESRQIFYEAARSRRR